jgi:hypothetical protein
MADLSSILGGMVQGFKDFGTGLVDMFGTGGAAIGDAIASIQSGRATTKNQDDFRKWLYNTDSTKDAAAKGLGTALNGVSTVADVIPGAQAVTANPLFNGLQGALGGVADELKMAGENADWGKAAQRAGVGAASGLASGYAGQALGKSGNKLLSNGLTRGAVSGALGGGIANAGYTGIEGGSVQDMINAGLYGAQTGALVGGTTGLARELIKPNHKMDVALTDEEKAARIANIDDQIGKLDLNTPEGNARYNELMRARAIYNTSPDKIQRLYHQTSANSFDEFSPERRSAGVMDQGTPSGIFLKDGSEDIGLPGKNQLMFDVKMENPYEAADRAALTNYARSRSKTYANLYDQAIELDQKAANVYDDFTEQLQNKYKEYYYEPDAAKKALLKQDVDDLVKNIGKLSKEKAAEYRSKGAEVAQKAQNELNRILKQDGYDSVILDNDKGSFGRSIKSYVALDPYEQLAEVKPKTVADLMAESKQKTVADLMLSPDDDVMYSKVAEGQLGLFDQPIAEEEVVDAVNSKNPYAPVDGKVTKAMRDRYNELMTSADGFNQITDNELYNKIDRSTLPKGYDKLQQLLDNQMGENNKVAAELKKGIGTDMPLQADLEKLADYVYGDEINGKNTFLKDLEDSIRLNRKNAEFVGIDAEQAEADARSHAKQKLVSKAMEKAERKVIDDIVGTGDSDDILYALQNYRRRGIRTGRAGALDTALSERLGIAPGNTVKITDVTSDDHLKSGSLGRYARNARDIALSDINSPEGKISTMAHERLHSFQNEARPESAGRYSPEVAEAYRELQKDLGHHYKSHAEIRKHWKKNVDYYANSGEQESRMFQQYLENKGYTDNSAYRGLMNQSGEWGNEINPAFDKFINKLRALSKKGVALPAVTALLGGGAIAGALTSGKDDKKKKSEVK